MANSWKDGHGQQMGSFLVLVVTRSNESKAYLFNNSTKSNQSKCPNAQMSKHWNAHIPKCSQLKGHGIFPRRSCGQFWGWFWCYFGVILGNLGIFLVILGQFWLSGRIPTFLCLAVPTKCVDYTFMTRKNKGCKYFVHKISQTKYSLLLSQIRGVN